MARAAKAKDTKSKKAKGEDSPKKTKKVKAEKPAKAAKVKKTKAEKPEKKSKRTPKAEKVVKSKDKAEKKVKRSKADKAEKGADKKSKKAKAKDTEVKKKGKKAAVEEDDEDETPIKKKSKKELRDEAASTFFNPYSNIDSSLDGIDKDLSLSGSSLNLNEQRMSTGLLGLDLVVGKGMVPGWYTFYGPEQSCKSTGAMLVMSSALTSNVPIKAYFDYEGCVVASSKIEVEYQQTTVGELIGDRIEATRAEGGLDVSSEKLHISSAGVRQNVLSISSKGEKPIHSLKTETGRELEGFAHPILCVNKEGLLEWKLQEAIEVGDSVVTQVRKKAA